MTKKNESCLVCSTGWYILNLLLKVSDVQFKTVYHTVGRILFHIPLTDISQPDLSRNALI